MLRSQMMMISKIWLMVSAVMVLVAKAEIRYICETEYQDGLDVLDYDGYARCGDECRCVAVESICMKGKYFTNSKFSVVSVDYFETCKDCVCNWWGTEDFWQKATAAKFGLAVDLPVPTPVPAFSNYLKSMERVDGQPVTFDRTESTDITSLTDGCEQTLSCEMWLEADWEGDTTVQTYPCDYLIFDVCYGSYACECSNGYSMTTGAMPSKDQKPMYGSLSALLDIDSDFLDPENFPGDYDLLKVVAFVAGALLIVCSIPCICCVCCCCKKSKIGRVACFNIGLPDIEALEEGQAPRQRNYRSEAAQMDQDRRLAANLAQAEEADQDIIAMYNSQRLYQSQHEFLQQEMPPLRDQNDHQHQPAVEHDAHQVVDNRGVVLDLPRQVDHNPQEVIRPSVQINHVPQEEGQDPFRQPGDISQGEIVNPQDLPGRVSLLSAANNQPHDIEQQPQAEQYQAALNAPQRHNSQISIDSNPRISAALPAGAMVQAMAIADQQEQAVAPQDGNDQNEREEAKDSQANQQNGRASDIFSHGF